MTGARAAGKHHGGRGCVIDHSGQTFGRLFVVRRLDKGETAGLGFCGTSAYWLCRCCRCGAEKSVMGSNLRARRSRSCGSPQCRGQL